MYIPTHFALKDSTALHRIIREHPLGMLVTPGDHGPDADHLPFEFDPTCGELGLRGAGGTPANPLWQRSPAGTRVLVVFRGAQAFVSPSWYPSKHETHRQVPTWNYEVVHAHGILAVRDDERYLRGLVARLTRQHEAAEPRPWRMTDAPPDYIDAMLRNIVGIEISVTSLVGKSKLSQNKTVRDRLSAADMLDMRGQAELAQAMRSTT
jgi:transcriptional regulator